MSLELNKIAASVLTAGVVAMGSGFVANVLVHPHVPEEPHYAVAPQAGDGGGAEQPAEPAGPKPIAPLLAEADVAAGEGATRACAACHSFEKGGPTKVGPNLYGIVGNDIAGDSDFSYSDALSGKEGDWDYAALNGFLHDPQGWAPGTKMSYSGISDVEKRANLVAYLRQNDDDPEPLPTEQQIAAATSGDGAEADDGAPPSAGEGTAAANGEQTAAAPTEDGASQLAVRLQNASASEGESGVRVCQACHSFNKGGPNKVGPNLYDIVGGPIAGAEGFSYSDALKGKEGNWTYAKLDAFLENPQGWASGTRMTYAGIKDAEKRADVILYLREQGANPPPLPGAGGDDAAEAQPAGDAGQDTADTAQAAGEADTAQAESSETAAAETADSGAADDGQTGATQDDGQAGDTQTAETGQPETAASGDDAGDSQETAAGGASGLVQQIAAADPAAGQSAAGICQACHSFNKGGPNKVGPNLYGVVGAEIASTEGFSYSNALKGKSGEWTYEKLDAFLENPMGWAPGTRMAYPGVKDADKRAAIIAYLRQQADSPVPLE